MTIPVRDDIDTAVQAWLDGSIAVAPISKNVDVFNQVANAKDDLVDSIFNGQDAVSIVAASGALTSSANYADGETVVVGLLDGTTKTYTFQASLTNTDGHVKVGANEAASIANLHHAINGAGGTPGTDYALSTVAHPDVTATDDSTHIVTLTANEAGTVGNAIVTTTTGAHAAFAHATLVNGAGDNVENAVDRVDDWRDTLRAEPLAKLTDEQTQLDAAIPTLKTAIEALYA